MTSDEPRATGGGVPNALAQIRMEEPVPSEPGAGVPSYRRAWHLSEAAKGAADIVVVSDEHKCQTVSLKLKEETGVQPDTDFPIAMLQPLEAEPVGTLTGGKIIQEAVHCVDRVGLPMTSELLKGAVVAGEILNAHVCARLASGL